jgi:D-erythronate 2-dehydrogenase
MHVLVIGAAGMIGRKLVNNLLSSGQVGGHTVSRLTLHDIILPDKPEATFPVSMNASDISLASGACALLTGKPDLIFHLAAVVSGEAEAMTSS